MTKENKTPKWVQTIGTMEYGDNYRPWAASASKWIRQVLEAEYGDAFSEWKFSVNHYEWYAFAKINEKWIYLSSGDARYNIMNSLLVRHALDPKDFTGGANLWVMYNAPDFEASFIRLINQMVKHGNL